MLKKLIAAIFGNTNITSTKSDKPLSIKEQRAQMVKKVTIDTSKVESRTFDALGLSIGKQMCLAEFFITNENKEKSFTSGFSFGPTQDKVGMRVVKITITRHVKYGDYAMVVVGEEKNGKLWRAFIQHEEGDNSKVFTSFKDLRWNEVREAAGKYYPETQLEAYTIETIEVFAKMFPNPQYSKLYSRFRTAVKKHNSELINK